MSELGQLPLQYTTMNYYRDEQKFFQLLLLSFIALFTNCRIFLGLNYYYYFIIAMFSPSLVINYNYIIQIVQHNDVYLQCLYLDLKVIHVINYLSTAIIFCLNA